MHLVTFISAAAALAATATATTGTTDRNAVELNQQCNQNQPYARVVNRCDYPVYLWSVYKGEGCPDSGMVTLNKGEVYNENYNNAAGGDVGVSIKISKAEECKGSDIVQLEYFLQTTNPQYAMNYLDISYIDCEGEDCPTRKEGYYLQAGNQTGAATASASNTWCPILSCSDAASCAKMSYILPDDVQTKTCDLHSSLDFYMCGGEAPTGDYDSSPASPSNQPAYSAPSPSPSPVQGYPTSKSNVGPASITNMPQIKEPEKPQKTKTQVVYVTAYEYVNAKRHAHGHARRHQPFHA